MPATKYLSIAKSKIAVKFLFFALKRTIEVLKNVIIANMNSRKKFSSFLYTELQLYNQQLNLFSGTGMKPILSVIILIVMESNTSSQN